MLAAYRKLLAGSVLFTVSFMVYPVREMFFATNTLFPVIGPCVAAGLALMVLDLRRPPKSSSLRQGSYEPLRF